MHPYFTFKLRRFGMITHPIEQGISCVKEYRTVYLGTWGNPVPNRACIQKVSEVEKQISTKRSVQVDMVRAILHEFQFPFHPREGGYLICAEIFKFIFRAGLKGSEFTHKFGSFTKGIIKEMNGKPKSTGSRLHANAGPAKASNSYAVRGIVVAVNGYVVPNRTRSMIKSSL